MKNGYELFSRTIHDMAKKIFIFKSLTKLCHPVGLEPTEFPLIKHRCKMNRTIFTDRTILCAHE